MMGKTHSATGAAAGFGATAVYLSVTGSDPNAALLAAGTLTGAGAALLPDLDHPNATATNALGPLTRAAGWVLRATSRGVYTLTGTRYDDGDGAHRALTHTALFALALGVLVGWAASTWTAAAFGLLWFTISLALRGATAHFSPNTRQRALTTWLGVTVVGGVLAGVLVWDGTVTGPYLGVAVTLGMVVHVLGDMITREAAPLAWPYKIRGKRWYDLGLPSWARITTGSDSAVEKSLTWVSWSVPVLGSVLMLGPF